MINNKKYIAILDTETIVKGQKVFDIGIIIADVEGNIITEKQWLLNETFFLRLFYEEKRELYANRLENPKYPTVIVNLEQAMAELGNVLDFFRVKEVYAYNAQFDSRVIEKLCVEYDVVNPLNKRSWECLWYWSAQSFMQKESYGKFCINNNHLSPKGNYKTSAETAYAYLIGEPQFVEEHTGLEDCKIELEIYKACRKQHSMRAKGMASNPWLLVQPQENIDKLPPQFRSMKISIEAKVDQAMALLVKLNKVLNVEVDVRIGKEEV